MVRNPVTRRETLQAVLAGSLGTVGFGAVDIGTATEHDGDGDRYVVGTESGAATRDASNYAVATYRTLDFGSRGGATVGYFEEETLEQLREREDVRYVEKDHKRQAYNPVETRRRDAGRPAARAPLQDVPWGLDRIGAEEPPNKVAAERNPTIAILDSGIDPTHESLEVADGYALAECAFGDCETAWADESGHGTHCAGTAAALDNDIGVVGVNPDAELYAVKVLGGDGNGSDSDIAAGIEWCADNDIDVINMSLGGPEPGQVLEDALEYAYERGVLIVAAAGNAGPNNGTIDYPARYDQCIAVAATDSRDEVPRWSSRGEAVELAAPGEEIVSTAPDDEYDTKSGTSMSAPHVAGVAAELLASGVPNAENTDDVDDPGGARAILRETANDLGLPAEEQGYGLLDAAAAYEEIRPLQTDTVSQVRATSAQFNAVVRTLGEADSATATFQWREAGADGWAETDSQRLSESGEFSADVSGLEPDTEYEVRAVTESTDGSEHGDVLSFTTGLADVVVETEETTPVDDATVTAAGDLLGMADAEEATVAFQWREAGAEEWTETDPDTRNGIGGFDGEITGLEPETEYEVRAVVEADGTSDAGAVLSVATEPEPGAPEIDAVEIVDDSNRNAVRARVNWTVTDPDGDLREVTSELRYADEGELLHASTSEIEGETETGTHLLRHDDRLEGAGEEYEITFSATDGEGNVTEITEEVTLDERSPPPSVDHFSITPTDFLGRPRADVEWAVSDAGGELWDFELELRYADGEETLDTATSMVRGDEHSGSDSLTDDDESAMGREYDVTLAVTDYFDQTTTETTRVTIDE
ncbi:S8 family serine peptidase [Natrialbaceae archaeon A-gly3]